MYDIAYQALLEEAIAQGERETLGILISKMLRVDVLRSVGEEEIQDYLDNPEIIPSSPFITDDTEVMRLLLKTEIIDVPQSVIWNAENGVRYMKAVPLAVAFEYGNRNLLALFAGRRLLEGGAGNC